MLRCGGIGSGVPDERVRTHGALVKTTSITILLLDEWFKQGPDNTHGLPVWVCVNVRLDERCQWVRGMSGG